MIIIPLIIDCCVGNVATYGVIEMTAKVRTKKATLTVVLARMNRAKVVRLATVDIPEFIDSRFYQT